MRVAISVLTYHMQPLKYTDGVKGLGIHTLSYVGVDPPIHFIMEVAILISLRQGCIC